MSGEPVRELGEGVELPIGRGAPERRRLAVTVDPRHGNAERGGGHDVVEVALRRVQPATSAQAPARGLEVSVARLVRAHLLRGDDHVEGYREMPSRRREEVVVDVGQDAERVPGADETLEGGV